MIVYHERIVSDHQVMLGKPVIKGTRLAVEMILRKLSQGATTDDLLKMYPHLTHEDIQAVYLYAADIIANEEPFETAA
jgi:uncharacterized protein (DUF433 family)